MPEGDACVDAELGAPLPHPFLLARVRGHGLVVAPTAASTIVLAPEPGLERRPAGLDVPLEPLERCPGEAPALAFPVAPGGAARIASVTASPHAALCARRPAGRPRVHSAAGCRVRARWSPASAARTARCSPRSSSSRGTRSPVSSGATRPRTRRRSRRSRVVSSSSGGPAPPRVARAALRRRAHRGLQPRRALVRARGRGTSRS